MRLLWVGHRDIENPSAGGAERTAFEICQRLVLRGFRVTILSGGWKGAPNRSRLNGVDFQRLPTWFLPHLVLPVFAKQVSRADVVVDDLAHVVPWLTPWFVSAKSTAFFRHLHARTLWGQVSTPTARLLALIERSYPALYRDTRFVTESIQSVQDLNSLGIPVRLIRRIPPGVDSGFFTPGTSATFPKLIYFAGMRTYKRPELAVQAFELVARSTPEARLTIIGVGPSIRSVQKAVSDRNLGAKVDFLGRVSRDRLQTELASSWVNFHTSVAEGWGLSIMEASSAGVPTVAFEVPGVSEVVQNGVNGTLVPDGDVDQLAYSASQLITLHGKLFDTSRRWALSFPWEKATDSWQSHLESLLEN